GSYGTYSINGEGLLAGQHVLGSTFPNWNDTKRGAGDVQVAVSGGTLSQILRLGPDDVVHLAWEHVGTAGPPAGGNQVAATWRLTFAQAESSAGTVQPFG